MNKPAYSLEGDRFVIQGYDRAPAFSSFLPGIAGVHGIPLWVYTTNRGQGVHSVGVHHKGNAILEFNPANIAYENVSTKGFRTFLRVNGQYVEPFSPLTDSRREMHIEENLLKVIDTHEALGIRTEVSYVVLPNEPIGALCRRLAIYNIGSQPLHLEVLDGLPRVIPHGLQLGVFKEMSNLMKSWADVRGTEHDLALYAMRSSTEDAAEVKEVSGSHYYLSLMAGERQPVLYDPDVIFGSELSLQLPLVFLEEGLAGVRARPQCHYNKYACGFTGLREDVPPGGALRLDSLLGFCGSDQLLLDMLPRFSAPDYFDRKEEEARALVAGYTKDVWTRSGRPLFDAYIRQSYLDNVLRGGHPLVLGQGSETRVLHLYSRKHGDPERDYNFFTTAGSFYSQGNGNFRDVCQNRRHDVSMHSQVGDFNVWTFLSLIQLDGYNPLEIRPASFLIPEEHLKQAQGLLHRHLVDPGEELYTLLQQPFTPGQLCSYIQDRRIQVTGSLGDLVEGLLALSVQRIEAAFGEGYWSDHFDYCLDLIEDYLSIYPDREQELFFGRQDYGFYDSPAYVRPLMDTQVITGKGLRHYGALAHDQEKAAQPSFQPQGSNWLKDQHGNKLTTNLFGKLLCLAANKVALLDPSGLGILMDGGKPGWNDAMNGLPGLMGSGMAETIELRRLLDAMLAALPQDGSQELPLELADFLLALGDIQTADPFAAWQHRTREKEAFRARIRQPLTGDSRTLPYARIHTLLSLFRSQVDQGIQEAMRLGQGIMPTYFTHEAASFEPQQNSDGSPRMAPYGLPAATAAGYVLRPLPSFLEGPARMLLAAGPGERADMAGMAARVKASGIYDKALKMYKTSESLEALSMEYGRIRAFTPGWLERESVFLHMEYKYLLGLLTSGLYEEFFTALEDAFIPFQNPETYGRSILENSSFIASSMNPDPATHGRGYVARLSGSTAEVLSMWQRMLLGPQKFVMMEGQLAIAFAPILPAWLFDETGEVAFRFLSACEIRYVNRERRDTFGSQGVQVRQLSCLRADGSREELPGNRLTGLAAQDLRAGRILSVTAHLG